MDETDPALQSNDAGNVPMPESSDEGAYERALLQEAASEDGSRPSVDAFMRHLTEYIHSSHHQTVTLPTSSCGIGTESETAPALQPDADASAPMLASSAESGVESTPPDEPSGGDGLPPAVEAFMRHLTEFFGSQTATQSSNDAGELKLGANAEASKDLDPVLFLGEADSQGESSDSARHSAPASVTPDAAELKLGESTEASADPDPVPFPNEPDPQGESSASARHSGSAGVTLDR